MSAALRRATPRLATLWAIAALLCVMCPAPARAQGEGARAYELAPAGSQALNLYGMFGRGNASFDPGSGVLGGVEADVYGSIIEYAHGFTLWGKAGSLIVSLPFGEARRSVDEHTDSRSGIGDMQVTAAFGLVGSPALGDRDYETYRPRFALSLLTRVYVPTGAYERNAPVNLGQNRWALQLGLPCAYYLGDSFLDPSLTSFEIIPSVIWYGDNNEPPSGNRSSQAPLLQLEGHITRNLNPTIWVSLDALFIEGGETTTDGVSDNNRQRSFALGATVSVALSDAVSTTLSYTDEASRDKSGVRGHVIRLIAEFSL
jgi:hypothetical protein